MFETLTLNPGGLVAVLPMLGKGILGVFVVICAIWAFVALLNKATARKKRD